jgi:hypothetical protein
MSRPLITSHPQLTDMKGVKGSGSGTPKAPRASTGSARGSSKKKRFTLPQEEMRELKKSAKVGFGFFSMYCVGGPDPEDMLAFPPLHRMSCRRGTRTPRRG